MLNVDEFNKKILSIGERVRHLRIELEIQEICALAILKSIEVQIEAVKRVISMVGNEKEGGGKL